MRKYLSSELSKKEMSKLIICLKDTMFTLDVKKVEKNEEGEERYWNYYLNTESQEITRLLRFLGYGTGYEPVWVNVRLGNLVISKTKKFTKGFFGTIVTTRYFLKKPLVDEELDIKTMYLEE